MVPHALAKSQLQSFGTHCGPICGATVILVAVPVGLGLSVGRTPVVLGKHLDTIDTKVQ